MDRFLTTETLIIEMLLIVSLVALAVRRLRVPYTVALVLVGLLITVQQTPEMHLTPELILALFVPPLVFEAAFHLQLPALRDNFVTILALAVPGVILTTLVVGLLVSLGAGMALPSALVFGALIAATDPVAVVALFRALGAPKSLTVLVEGESLLNDGTAIVVFEIMLVSALSAASGGTGQVNLFEATLDFLRVSLGGAALGLGLGWLTAWIISRVDDYLIETTLTTVLAFGAYLAAERLHVSGVLAVVAAGVICGTVGPRGMSPTTRIVLFNFWEYLAFVANSLVFLLIGLEVRVLDLIDNIMPIAIAVGAVLASRALVVYGLTWIPRLIGRPVPYSYRHVLYWGGLRGAISLALALSLPGAFVDRGRLQVMTFGVVLFSLLAQGTTMNALMARLRLVHRDERELAYERNYGRLMSARAARDRLEELYRTGLVSPATRNQLAETLEAEVEAQQEAQQKLLQAEPQLRAEQLETVRRETLRARRAMLLTLSSEGILSETVYEELITAVDAALVGVDTDDQDDQPDGTAAQDEPPQTH